MYCFKKNHLSCDKCWLSSILIIGQLLRKLGLLIPAGGKVHLAKLNVIKFANDFQVGGFLWVQLQFPPPVKLTASICTWQTCIVESGILTHIILNLSSNFNAFFFQNVDLHVLSMGHKLFCYLFWKEV